jgi:hypothetical protein
VPTSQSHQRICDLAARIDAQLDGVELFAPASDLGAPGAIAVTTGARLRFLCRIALVYLFYLACILILTR